MFSHLFIHLLGGVSFFFFFFNYLAAPDPSCSMWDLVP